VSVLGSVHGPRAELVDAVFHFADAVADFYFRERHLRKYMSAHGQAYDDGSDERILRTWNPPGSAVYQSPS
jgi:hypothetical protein